MSPKLKETIRGFLPTQLKDHRIRTGPIRGCRIYTSWHNYPGAIRGTTERHLLAWFGRHVKPGETWLDIGAHYGYTAIALSKLVGRAGRVMAFEPVLSTAGCVAHTRELNGLRQLQIIPLGLSLASTIDPVRLPVSRGMADNTIAKTDWDELIFATSFDVLWESLSEGKAAVDGVKIDVQGMEGDVLAGMKKTLCRWKPKLVVEFHEGVDREKILLLLEKCGYSRYPEAIEPHSEELESNKSFAFFPYN